MKILWGIVGLYAVFCFWAPVLWLTDHLMEVYKFDQFRFSYMHWAAKIFYVLVNIMSLATMFAIMGNLKEPDFLKNE